MALSDYLLGAVFLLGTFGSTLTAAILVAVRRLGHLSLPERALAVAMIVSGGLTAVHMVPGVLGLLSRWNVLASGFVLLVAVEVATRRSVPRRDIATPHDHTGRRVGKVELVALLALALLGLWVMAAAWRGTAVPPVDVDTLDFHLPGVARWVQSGTLWPVTQLRPFLPNGYYPQNGDVIFLAVVLPWKNVAFVRLVNPLFLAVAVLAVYCLAIKIRASWGAAAMVAAVFGSLPVLLLTTESGTLTDVILVAMLGGGCVFLLRHLRSRLSSDLVLGGLGLGLAFGTKWYGVTSVVVIFTVWFAANVASRRPIRSIIADASRLIALVALAGGFWLLRNFVASGNPIYPIRLHAFGRTLFNAPFDVARACSGFSIAHYVGRWDVWKAYLVPAFWNSFSLPGGVLAIAMTFAIIVAIRSGKRIGRADDYRNGMVLWPAAAVVLLVATYVVTPYSAFGAEGRPIFTAANSRYALPALFIAAALAGLGLDRLPRGKAIARLGMLLIVLDGIRRGSDVPRSTVAFVAVGLATICAVGYLSVRFIRHVQRPIIFPVAFTAGAAVLLAALVVGYARQETFNQSWYLGKEPAVDRVLRLAPHGHRVGIAGIWSNDNISPVFPSFGPRLANDVTYIGRTVRGEMRPFRSRDEFAGALVRERIDLVVVGKETTGACGRRLLKGGLQGAEVGWAEASGFEKVAESRRLAVFSVGKTGR